jgi:hypothetical protein
MHNAKEQLGTVTATLHHWDSYSSTVLYRYYHSSHTTVHPNRLFTTPYRSINVCIEAHTSARLIVDISEPQTSLSGNETLPPRLDSLSFAFKNPT